jgi:DNA-binding SARP family transcriptional activator
MGAEEAIRSTGGMLSLWGGDVEVDVERFLGAADTALANGDEEGCGLAADLYTGEPMPADRYEAWAAEPRTRLRSATSPCSRAPGDGRRFSTVTRRTRSPTGN